MLYGRRASHRLRASYGRIPFVSLGFGVSPFRMAIDQNAVRLREMGTSLGRVIWIITVALASAFAQQPTPSAVVPPGTIGPDGAYRFGNGVAAPTAVSRVAGTLPDLARQLRASGEVLLSLVVQTDGSMRDVQIIKSAGYGMDDKAIEAVRKWRFRPGTKEGKPVDVRIQVALSFSVAPEKNTWGAGPLLFEHSPGINLPILKSGSMPKAVRQSGDETVVLQFIVNSAGDVTDVHALQGENSTSLPVLIASVSNWKFAPTSDGNTSVSATGKVLLVKGEDQFRYEVASAFRDTGKPEPKAMVASTNTSSPPTAIVVPVKIRLEADEANKQLVHRVEPRYPPDAKAAGIEGKVILEVTIGIDGKVSDVREIMGPKELMPAAVAAVKQWEYSPTIFHGRPQLAIAEVELQFETAK